VRGYVVVGAFVLAAVVTPPDVLSQILLAAPLCLLYEIGILAAAAIEKRKPVSEDEAGAARELSRTDEPSGESGD
jgi:sec-independent protein translocase protein TatC